MNVGALAFTVFLLLLNAYFVVVEFALVAARENLQRCRRSELEQRTQGAGGRSTRLEFEHLPEQDECGDHRGRFEIHSDAPGMIAKC